jgi:hypothetical protein
MGLGLVLAVALPVLIHNGFFLGRAMISPQSVGWLMPIYYSFCLPAYVALAALERMLAAVKRGEVFTNSNVRRLRTISWCCFVAAIVLLASSLVSIVFFALAVLAAFFGVVLRAVKNLFAAAVELKAENDFTI